MSSPMLGRLPSLTLVRLWAALLLATIGLQATVSAAPSLERKSGSAFSATTYEVALYVQRADRVQRQAVTPLPATPLDLGLRALPALGPTLVGLPALRPDSTGPPLRKVHSWYPAPRGPPRA